MAGQEEGRGVGDMTFREGMDELGQIVNALESNTLELEECLRRYERGITLLRELRGRLDSAQQRVVVLLGELDQTATDDEIDTRLSKA